jgi:excisionase family DNA binding protein
VTGGDDEFLTVAEIAAILKLNQQTVRNWIDQGTLGALHVGRRVRIRRSDFDALLERSRTGGTHTADRSLAQAFWEGEYLPTSLVDLGEGD